MRVALFLFVALLIFLPFNWLTVRQLLRVHPRRKRWIIGLAVAGNLMWLFFPLLRALTPFSRAVRAILGPAWFGWTCFTLLYSAFLLLVLIAWLFARRHRFADFARWPSRVFLVALIAGFLLGLYQALVPLRIERVPVRISNLPASADGMKIALLTDLHVGLFTRRSRLDRIFATTSSLRPDVVLIAGDMIDDDPHFVPKLLAGTRALAPAIPLLGVLGNHEMYGDASRVVASFRGTRLRLLVNEGVPFGELWIAGVSDRAAAQSNNRKLLAPDLGKALRAKPASSVAIALSHQPSIIAEARRLGVPLALTGHSHGGQLGFRPLRWSLAGVFLPHHMGLYDVAPTQLYVSTGTGFWLFPFRLGMTPEITVIELTRG